jgi:hypothetical protein
VVSLSGSDVRRRSPVKRPSRRIRLAPLLALSALQTACPPPWWFHDRHEERHERRDDRDERRGDRHEERHERRDDRRERHH